MQSEQEPPTGARRGIIILLCFLVAMLEGFDLQVIGVAAPQLTRELGMTPQEIGWAFGASLIGLAIGALTGGRLADKVGRKPVLVGSVIAFGAATLASAWSWDFHSLFVLRLLTGLGLGGTFPNVIAIASEVTARARVTVTVASISSGLAVGGIIVSLMARLAPGGMDWRGLFIVGGALPLLVAPALWHYMAETKRTARQGPADRIPIGQALFGHRQAGATLMLWLVFALTLLQLSLLLNWLPTLIIAKGFPPAQAFTTSLVLNIGSIFGSIIAGVLCDRYGARGPMAVGYFLMALVMYLLSLASDMPMLLVVAFLAGFLVLGAQFALYGLAPKVYPDQTRGTGVGAAVAAGRVGAISGPLIAGQMIGAGATGDQVVLLMVPLALLAGVALLALAHLAGDRLRAAGGAIMH